MNYLNDGASLNFDDIKKEIIYAVGAGSQVEDKMGSEFDLVPGTFQLTVGGKALTCIQNGNTYSFGDDVKFDIPKVIYTISEQSLSYDANGGIGTMSAETGVAGKIVTVAQNGFTRNNYTFIGWNTQADGKGTAYKAGDSFTLTDKDTVLYAQWSKNSGSAGTGTNGKAKPTDSQKTGDNSNLALWFALLFVSGGAVTATIIYGRKNKRSVK